MGQTATFKIGHEPMINVDIMDINGMWVTVPMLVDTGNASTIVDFTTAQNILHWNMEGDYQRSVRAVFGEAQNTAVSEQVYIKIGNTRPIETNIIMANVNSGNLLGYDIMQQFFRITFDGDTIIMEQRDDCAACVNDQYYYPEFNNYTETRALWGEEGYQLGEPPMVDGAYIDPIHLPHKNPGRYYWNT